MLFFWTILADFSRFPLSNFEQFGFSDTAYEHGWDSADKKTTLSEVLASDSCYVYTTL